VSIDTPIAANVDWTPHVYATNGEKYGIDVQTIPFLDSYWLDTFKMNVKLNQPSIKICLAFPFEVALRLNHNTIESFIKENLSIIVVYDDDTLDFFNNDQARVPSRQAHEIMKRLKLKKANLLSTELSDCPKGRKHFSDYEKVCLNIFGTLFVPPLDAPNTQSSTASRLRRRDHIFPNNAGQGFWYIIVKNTYCGTQVLIECKNLFARISPDEIDDIAKYLSRKGIGLFGLIFSRKPPNPNAKLLQISKWKDEDKLILILEDSDLLEMIELYANEQDPSEVIQRKINEFLQSVQ
jgi:hypothetical protein